MKRFAWVWFACACATGKDARVEAFGWLEKKDYGHAAASLSTCLYSGDEGERFLCESMLGEVRMLEHRWGAAATAFRSAFEIRDRIAADRHYGEASVSDLVNWGYALVEIGESAKAKVVFERATRGTRGDPQPFFTAAYAALAAIAHARGDFAEETKMQTEASAHACELRDLHYFRAEEAAKLTASHLPPDAWIAIGDACSSSASARHELYAHAMDEARRENDAAAVSTLTARIAKNGP